MRKILLLPLFFFLTPAVLIFSLLFLSFIYRQNSNILISFNQSPKVSYAAIPADTAEMKLEANAIDARVTAVESFLSFYKSPLLPFAAEIVATADKYNMDYRLIPAIAMEESTLCKNLPAKYKNTHNCWGFGIYGKNVTSFDSYSEAIDTITKTLATKYKAAGLETPEEIMSKYNPVSSNGSWAGGVTSFMDKLSITTTTL